MAVVATYSISSSSSTNVVYASFSNFLTSSASVGSCWCTSKSRSIGLISFIVVGAFSNGVEYRKLAPFETPPLRCQLPQIHRTDISCYPRSLSGYIRRHPLRWCFRLSPNADEDLYNEPFIPLRDSYSNNVFCLSLYREKKPTPCLFATSIPQRFLHTHQLHNCSLDLLCRRVKRNQTVPPVLFQIFCFGDWRVVSVFGFHTDKVPTTLYILSYLRHGVAETKSFVSVTYRIMMLSTSERGLSLRPQ